MAVFSVEKIIKTHNSKALIVSMKKGLVILLGDLPKVTQPRRGAMGLAGPDAHILTRVLFATTKLFICITKWFIRSPLGFA